MTTAQHIDPCAGEDRRGVGDGRPRLLDLFCGAGGCTAGYQRAGFYVVGIDVKLQPNYCGDQFMEADALDVLRGLLAGANVAAGWGLKDFDAIHASPPCQASSSLRALSPHIDYPELIPPTREMLERVSLPHVIENVVGAKLYNPVTICGATYCPTIVDDGNLYRLQRHRLFETNFPLMVSPCSCDRRGGATVLGIYGGGTRQDTRKEANPNGGNTQKANKAQAAALMGIDWMTRDEMCQAIPPAYTEHIGGYLMQAVERERERVAA